MTPMSLSQQDDHIAVFISGLIFKPFLFSFPLLFSLFLSALPTELSGQSNADDPTLPSSYVILAKKEVKLKQTIINQGGIGLWGTGSKVDIKDQSIISTFIRADEIRISTDSEHQDLMRLSGPAPSPLFDVPEFLGGGDAEDLRVKKSQNGTFSIAGNDFKKIEIEENNRVRFSSSGIIYLEELKVRDAGNNEENIIEFSGPTTLIIKKKFDLGKRTRFNHTEQDNVVVYVLEGDADIKEQSYVYATIDARRGKIQVSKSKRDEPTIMEGKFIAEKVDGNENVEWVLRIPGSGNIEPYYPPPAGGKTNDIIGSELLSLSTSSNDPPDIEVNFVYQIEESPTDPNSFTVLIEVIVIEGQYQAALSLLQSLGLSDLIDNGEHQLIISGQFPIDKLDDLNHYPDLINYVRPVYLPIVEGGAVTTRGDSAQLSNFVRNGYELKGSGLKIGVISDSYDNKGGAALDIAQGDLPSNGVQVLEDMPGGQTDEGRAMLQIIHDIAPEAELAFKTGFKSAGHFAASIIDLQQAGCDVIVDDVTYITEPFLKDGLVAQAVEAVTDLGVTYVSAAGNYRENSYTGTFTPATAPANVTGTAHDYGNGDIFQRISLKPDDYLLVLQWQDEVYSIGETTSGTTVDLDIYLTNEDGSTLFGFNRNNIGGDPIEVLPFTVRDVDAVTNIMVVNASGDQPVRFKVFFFRGQDFVFEEYTEGGATIVGQANAESAITVGAVLYSNTPAFGVDPPTVASFSSLGGSETNGIIRSKPDICAPNGVNTTVDLGGENIDGDQFYNFFGTSAAAPHVAAAAALIIEGKNKYYNEVLSPQQVKDLMTSTALDMGDPGFDYSTGYGFLQADQALLAFANPKPEINEVVVPDNLTPGEAAFELIINGSFFTEESTVMFRDEPLTTAFVNSNQISCAIPEFFGNPVLYVSNPVISPSELDGGSSEPFTFLDPVKTTIIIRADDFTRKYGESNPVFTATISGLPEGTSLTEAGLDDLPVSYTTLAGTTSPVGNYIITPGLEQIEEGLLELYDLVFEQGILTIEKMPLLITPQEQNINYGDPLEPVTFTYEYDETNVPDNTVFLSQIESIHRSTLTDAIALVNGLALVNGIAIVNGFPIVNGIPLVNKSIMVSENTLNGTALVNDTEVISVEGIALVNGLALVNGIPIVNGIPLVNGLPIVNGIALVNAFALVNGTALVNDTNGIPLVNGIALVNGTALVNGFAIVNGTPIVNSTTTLENTNGLDSAIIITSSADIVEGIELNLSSINLISGFEAGTQWLIPGSFIDENFEVTYAPGPVNIACPGGSSEICDGIDNDCDGLIDSEDPDFSDETIPVVHTQNILVELDEGGQACVKATDIDNGSEDNCGIELLSLDQALFDCSDIGANLVTLTVTDFSGNTATAQATVTVVDLTAPELEVKDIALQLDETGQATLDLTAQNIIYFEDFESDVPALRKTDLVNWNVLAGDVDVFYPNQFGLPFCSNALDLPGDANGTIESKTSMEFLPGDYRLSFRALGNSPDAQARLEIGSLVNMDFNNFTGEVETKTVNFTVTAPTFATIKFTELGAEPFFSGTTIDDIKLVRLGEGLVRWADDNCGIESITADLSTFDCSHLGQNTVTVTAIDNSGNPTSTQINVTISDPQAPSIFCPGDLSLLADEGACGTVVNFTVTATDNCSANLAVTQQSELGNGDFFPVGTTIVNYSATDPGGQQVFCSFTVTVSNDNAPGIGCQDNITLVPDEGVTLTTINGNSSGNWQSDGAWQSFEVTSGFELSTITVVMSRYNNFINAPMNAILYQGIGTGGTVVGLVSMSAYNGGDIDFSTVDDGFPVVLSPGFYTLKMDAPGTFSNNYFWTMGSKLATDPPGIASNVSNGYTLHLTVTGAAQDCTVSVELPGPFLSGFGPSQTALAFDGINDRIAGTGPVIPTSGDYTVSVWAKQTVDQEGFREILAQGRRFYIGHTPDFNPNHNWEAYEIRVGDNWVNTGVMFPRDNKWHHYAVVRTSTNTHLYLDGVLVASKGGPIGSPVAVAPYTNDFYIASQFDAIGEHFGGSIDEIQVWNYALSGAEISCYMNQPLAGNENGLVAYYNFEDGPGSTVLTDISGNHGPFPLENMDPSTDWVPALNTYNDWTETTEVNGNFSICSVPNSVQWYVTDLNAINPDLPVCQTTVQLSGGDQSFCCEISRTLSSPIDSIDHSPSGVILDSRQKTGLAQPTAGGPAVINDSAAEWKVFPNPAQKEFQIRFGPLTQDTELVIFDALGREIWSKKLTAGTTHLMVNATDSRFGNGLYLVRMELNGRVFTDTIVIMK